MNTHTRTCPGKGTERGYRRGSRISSCCEFLFSWNQSLLVLQQGLHWPFILTASEVSKPSCALQRSELTIKMKSGSIVEFCSRSDEDAEFFFRSSWIWSDFFSGSAVSLQCTSLVWRCWPWRKGPVKCETHVCACARSYVCLSVSVPVWRPRVNLHTLTCMQTHANRHHTRTRAHTHTHTDALNDTKGKSRPEMTTSTGAKLENVNELVLSLSCHYMLTSDKFFHRSQAETSSYLERLHAGGQTYGCRL